MHYIITGEERRREENNILIIVIKRTIILHEVHIIIEIMRTRAKRSARVHYVRTLTSFTVRIICPCINAYVHKGVTVLAGFVHVLTAFIHSQAHSFSYSHTLFT